MRTPFRWLDRISPRSRDRALAFVLGLALVTIYGPWPLGGYEGGRWLAAVAAVAGCALLVWRREHPLPVFGLLGVALLVSIGWHLDSSAPLLFPGWIALYGVPAFGPRRAAALAGLGTGLATVGAVVFFVLEASGRGRNGLAVGLVFTVAYVATAWLLGRYRRIRQAYLTELEERAARLTREQAAVAAQVVAEERARIARELHDMLAHTMSGMIVLAGGARRIVATRPSDAADALAEIERAGRRGMAETRLLLDALRTQDESTVTAQPTLRELPALAERMRATGLPVVLRMNGPLDLPAAVDAAAYRIVQEALTNTLRHAGNATAEVTIRSLADGLELDILDDGTPGELTEPGHGLDGMRERARLLGGELRAGPRPGGGWAVHARLPVAIPVGA